MARWNADTRYFILAQVAATALAAILATGCLPCGDGTGPQCAAPGQGHKPPAARVIYYRTNFADGTTGPLDVYAYGGGSCQPSLDEGDAGSAYSIKCTIPAGATGAAALQAWFGHGKLAGLPLDPSLDQDLFQQVRFVLAPGALAAVGGTTCTALNPTSQFKVHKSVYGQAGSAWNGWVMSNIAPCSDGPIGLQTEFAQAPIDGWSKAIDH